MSGRKNAYQFFALLFGRPARPALVLLLIAFFIALPAEGSRPENQKNNAKRILLIFPYNLSFAQQYSLSSNYFDTLSQTGISYSLTQLELDTLKNPDPKSWQDQIDRFLPAIRNGTFDLIVTFGPNAFTLLRHNIAAVPQNIPVVFCGQTSFDPAFLKMHRNTTGIIHELNPAENIQLIKRLFPNTRRVILLTNWTEEGQRVKQLTETCFKNRKDLELIYIDNAKINTKQMLDKIAGIPDSAVLFYGWYNKDAINFHSLQTLMTYLENNRKRPLLVMHDAMLRYGAIGGVMARAGQTGKLAAELTARILSGEQAQNIPVTVQEDETLLTWNQIRFHDISEDILPEDAILLGKPKNFWELYKTYIIAAILFSFLVDIFTVALLFLYLRHRKLALANRRLAEYEAQVNEWLESIETAKDEDAALADIMEALAARLHAANAHIFRLDDVKGTLFLCQEMGEDQAPVEACRELELSAEWYRRLLNHETAAYPDMRSAAVLTELLPKEEISLMHLSGIWYENELWGCMTVEFSRNAGELPSDALKLLNATVHMAEIILARKKNKKLLSLSRYEKQLILDTLNIPILLFDRNCKLQRRNKAASDLVKAVERKMSRPPCYAAGFCTGKECREECPVKQTCRDRKMHSGIKRFEDREYQLTASPVFIEHELTYILTTLVDITELNENQRKLAEALQEAQDAAKAKSFFISGMNHELRTPLNAIIGFSELLQTTEMTPGEQKEYLTSISQAGNSLLSLLNDLMELSRLESGDFVQSKQPTDIKLVAKELLLFFKQKADARHLTLEMEESGRLPILELDSLRLKQIILNLLGNAVRFTIHGYVKIHVGFTRTAPDSGALEIRVEDTGIGIKEENRKSIFEPFAPQDSLKCGGTGHGLALSKRLAEKMGGSIQMTSEYGRGSTFTLRLEGVRIAGTPQEKINS